jgi:hypothetical protein
MNSGSEGRGPETRNAEYKIVLYIRSHACGKDSESSDLSG